MFYKIKIENKVKLKWQSLGIEFIKSLDKGFCIVGLIVSDNIIRIVRIDLIHVFSKLATRLSLYFLDLLEATTLYECSLGFQIKGKDLSKLSTNIGQNVIRSQLEEGF